MDKLLTVNELSEILKVPRSWIYERTGKNEIPTVQNLGRYKRFDPIAIKQWISKSYLTNELRRKVKP